MKLYNSVLNRVRIIEEKNGIRYAKTDGKLYKTLKILYSVVGAYSLAINLFIILGMTFKAFGANKFQNAENFFTAVLIGSILVVAGYVLSFFKFNLTAGIISIVPEIVLIVTFAANMKDSLGYHGYVPSFFWRHLIPLTLMVILMVWLTAIAKRADIKTKKQYKKVIANLYNQFKVANKLDDLSEISEEQWEEFLNSYNPFAKR